jgi:hypothetical protein
MSLCAAIAEFVECERRHLAAENGFPHGIEGAKFARG